LKPDVARQPESTIAEKPIATSDKVESAPAADDAKRSASAPDRSKLSKIERGGPAWRGRLAAQILRRFGNFFAEHQVCISFSRSSACATRPQHDVRT